MSKGPEKKLMQRARRCIPSGVNSPVRAFNSVGGTPVFARAGSGAFFRDQSGKKYLDFCASWGPLLFGHAPSGLIRRLKTTLDRGTSFGMPTEGEVELAEKIRKAVPAVEKCRLVSSGTEAVMSAVRLARGFTGRSKILKIDGGYHGHVDSLLIKAGSGGATFGTPDSAGIPPELSRMTLTIPFNDPDKLEAVFKKEGRRMAAFILEPVPANMGVVPPAKGYLRLARQLCRKYGVLLIFDEVITGFRLSRGGAGEFFGVKPDLVCLGKVLGGGLPLAAFGGRAGIMDRLAPAGPVYQAGTLSGNPLAVQAALWMLENLEKPGVLDKLNVKAGEFAAEARSRIREHGFPVSLNSAGSMFTLFFYGGNVVDYRTAKRSSPELYSRYFHACLRRGVYFAPSQFEAGFVSTAHREQDLQKTLLVIEKSLQEVFSS